MFYLLSPFQMSLITLRPRRCPSLALFLVFVLVTSALAAPHGGAPAVSRWKRKTSSHHKGVLPATFNYRVIRVEHCKGDDTLFADCYLCGKITDEIRIYNGCCEKKEDFRDFCDRLLA